LGTSPGDVKADPAIVIVQHNCSLFVVLHPGIHGGGGAQIRVWDFICSLDLSADGFLSFLTSIQSDSYGLWTAWLPVLVLLPLDDLFCAVLCHRAVHELKLIRR
jgi:hypothetical protein